MTDPVDEEEYWMKKNRAPRCHDQLTNTDDEALIECDRKLEHKGWHKATFRSSEGFGIEMRWEPDDDAA